MNLLCVEKVFLFKQHTSKLNDMGADIFVIMCCNRLNY